MTALWRSRIVSVLFIAFSLVALSSGVLSAQQESANKRKLTERITPPYPALARNMALEGVVRVEALVAADGSVKTVAIKGGHPVLAQAAVNAVRRWRWEPAAHETREAVEVKFSPE
jgi:TonB family protein